MGIRGFNLKPPNHSLLVSPLTLNRSRVYINETPNHFGGYRPRREASLYSVLGVPYDSTTSFRPGQRFAPESIRVSSAYIEFYSMHAGLDVDNIPIYDEGDLAVVPGDAHATISRLAEVISSLAEEGRVPIILGGEHTITMGVVSGLRKVLGSFCMIVFDAHFDLREEYLGSRLCHATFMRRVIENVRPEKIYYIGVRGFSEGERRLADSVDYIEYSSPLEISRLGEENIAAVVRRSVAPCKRLYISIDLDVLDPAFAPGVGNPEPLGLSALSLVSLLHEIIDERLIGLDVVELSPPFDQGGVTSILAARLVVEAVAAHHVKYARRKHTEKS